MTKKKAILDIDLDVIKEIVEYSENSPSCLVWRIRKGPRRKGDTAGHLTSLNYWRVRINFKLFQVHRVIWVLFNGKIPDEMEINHINCNPSDNRISNLELVSGRINNRKQKSQTTSKLQANNKSGVTGVHEYKHNRENPVYYAMASYKDIDGFHRSKSFSYKKYGKEEAWCLASIFIKDKRLEIDKQLDLLLKQQLKENNAANLHNPRLPLG